MRAIWAADGPMLDPRKLQRCAGPCGGSTTPPYVCPDCRAVSFHPKDREYGYCAACKRHTARGIPRP